MIKNLRNRIAIIFELNQRQVNLFLTLSLLFLLLLSGMFYDPWGSNSDIPFDLRYLPLDTLKVEGNVSVTPSTVYIKSKKVEEDEIPSEPKVYGELNKVTADQLQQVKGLGPVLSERIVKFRDRLGGFYKKEQLYEVYGLDSIVVERVFMHSSFSDHSITKLDVNTANYEELKSHPYLSWREAKAISGLRKDNIFLNEADVKAVVDSSIFLKVSPYLSY